MKCDPLSTSVCRYAKLSARLAVIVVVAMWADLARAQFGEIKGQVSTEAGEIVRGLTVRVIPSGKTASKFTVDVSNVTNQFSIPRVQPGTYDVAFCDGSAYTPILRRGVRVQEGDTPTVVSVVMSLQQTEDLSDVISSREHVPVRGTSVKLIHRATGCVVEQTTTDCQGRFHVRKAQNETYYLDFVGVSDEKYVMNACQVHGDLFPQSNHPRKDLASSASAGTNAFFLPGLQYRPSPWQVDSRWTGATGDLNVSNSLLGGTTRPSLF